MDVRWTSYGEGAAAALHRAVVEAKGGEPLAPVTVVVPSNHVGVASRRLLASGRLGPVAGAGVGVAGIMFVTPYRLAELLGASTVAATGRRPVSTPVLAAAIRAELATDAGLFTPVREHPATEAALVSTYREARDLSPAALDALARTSARAREVVRLHRAVRARVAPSWSDEEDLLEAATAAAGERAALELGALVVHLPQRITQHAGRLLAALAEHVPTTVIAGRTGLEAADAEVLVSLRRIGIVGPDVPAAGGRPETPVVDAERTTILTASDADEEVRSAVRAILDAVRAGTRLDRIAVLHASPEPYARLAHEQLARGRDGHQRRRRGPARGADGRPHPARAARPPHERVPPSGRARVAQRGADAGRGPMGAHHGLGADLPGCGDRGRPGGLGHAPHPAGRAPGAPCRLRRGRRRPARLGGRAGPITRRRASDLRRFVLQVIDDLAAAAAAPRPWSEQARWAQAWLERLLGPAGRRDTWPDAERKAAERVELALERLGALDAVEGPVALEVFARTLELELEADLGRVGRFGDGVLVGSVEMGIGLDLDLVVVLGLAEGSFPSTVRDDSLLPDGERAACSGELGLRADRVERQHRQLLAALAGGRRHLLCVPRGDLRRSVERVPSRWVLDLASAVAGVPWWAPELQRSSDRWVQHVASFDAGLRTMTTPATAQEHRLRSLLAAGGALASTDDQLAEQASPSSPPAAAPPSRGSTATSVASRSRRRSTTSPHPRGSSDGPGAPTSTSCRTCSTPPRWRTPRTTS